MFLDYLRAQTLAREHMIALAMMVILVMGSFVQVRIFIDFHPFFLIY